MTSKITVCAINCGSDCFVSDSSGIKYQNDTTSYRKSFHTNDIITNVPEEDQHIYQAHSWINCGKMVYEMPVFEDGDYVLSVMIYNHSPKHNIDITLNRTHEAVKNLSVFDKVGRNVAHKEKIRFQIQGNELEYDGKRSTIVQNRIAVEMSSPINGNIMVSALVLKRKCKVNRGRGACGSDKRDRSSSHSRSSSSSSSSSSSESDCQCRHQNRKKSEKNDCQKSGEKGHKKDRGHKKC